jgi:hypothetical protein
MVVPKEGAGVGLGRTYTKFFMSPAERGGRGFFCGIESQSVDLPLTQGVDDVFRRVLETTARFFAG